MKKLKFILLFIVFVSFICAADAKNIGYEKKIVVGGEGGVEETYTPIVVEDEEVEQPEENVNSFEIIQARPLYGYGYLPYTNYGFLTPSVNYVPPGPPKRPHKHNMNKPANKPANRPPHKNGNKPQYKPAPKSSATSNMLNPVPQKINADVLKK